jgi:EAL domain-containing protein (putative c-di-GMP-specific phosphodiesterase class I)
MVHCPQDAVDFEELTEMIDALSEMKKEDKKQISRVGELDLSRIHRKHKVENLVKVAVETEKLEVVYQPIYSKAEGRFTSAEALLRMRDEELGNVSPGEFIPIAERNGAILKIGSYVMDTVCRFISENELKKYGIDYIEINLSAVECLQEDLVESAMRHITKYSVNPDQINMEITETTVNTLPKRAEEKLRELRLKGFTFSLDDYGTGYSNLSRLANLPLNIVKIDKSIVQEAFTSEKMKVILDSTLQMLTQLNKKILAEGVEEKQQADYLLEHGCDYIQGYYYSRPIPAGEFLELIKGQ